jgi:hypothetical protein
MFYICSQMTATDPRSDMLSELSQCAYRLGLAFGDEAERAEDWARKLEYFRLFDRCFFAVRVATALELRLWRTPAAERDDLRDRADPPEDERADSGTGLERERLEDAEERDRDREREAEPASLPVLLRTLDGVAADAAALPGPEPAALPTLRELLAHVAPEPPPTPPSTPPRTDLRARLAGSGAAVTLQLAPRPAKIPGGLAVRRATGPPRR